MIEKKKMQLEFEIRLSPKTLHSFLVEANSLSQWFADQVYIRDNVYHFIWDDEDHPAKLSSVKENKSIRFTWIEDVPYYLEFKISKDELTNDVALLITDFVEAEFESERRLIWKNQIRLLLRALAG